MNREFYSLNELELLYWDKYQHNFNIIFFWIALFPKYTNINYLNEHHKIVSLPIYKLRSNSVFYN